MTIPDVTSRDYLTLALTGETRAAVELVMGLLDSGTSADRIIRELLAPAQREVGERWQRDELSVADEHVATAVTDAALHALSHATVVPPRTGLVVVACAEGDWHGIAARMFSELLRCRGAEVAFLGASTPADHVQGFILRHAPEALAISCSLPLYFAGVARLADAAHRCAVPALVGGRGLGGAATRAHRLGADAFGRDVDEALRTLASWRTDPPVVASEDTALPRHALELDVRAAELGSAALADLMRRFPPMADYDERQLAHTSADVVYLVQFVAAAALVDDAGVLTELIDWLVAVLAARGVPTAAVTAGLSALHPLVNRVDAACGGLVEAGLDHLG